MGVRVRISYSRIVSHGEAIFGHVVAPRLLSYFGSVRPTTKSGSVQFIPELTEREYEILTLIVHRNSNTDIIARLILSPKTVSNHVSNIRMKLQVADRTEAMHATWIWDWGRGKTSAHPSDT